jgi:XTP/dITP diphosphohydrolase
MQALLQGVPLELLSLADRPGLPQPAEAGATFAANARDKARHYAAAAGLLTVAEDSGLEIPALDGAPGVESRRYGGVDLDYPSKFALIYEALAARGVRDAAARFVCALALADPHQLLFEAQGTVEGRIAPEPRGHGGFGYDPIFHYPPFGCTLAEAGDRKAEVGHRAAAIRRLRTYLRGAEFRAWRARHDEQGRD